MAITVRSAQPGRLFFAGLALAFAFAQPGSVCVGLDHPVPAPIVREFAPIGRYAGHWGVDYQVAANSVVRSAGSGIVTFAGVVAGNNTVTVDHGGGLKTSYSHLTSRAVSRGQWVNRAAGLGTSGLHDALELLHFSTRVDGVYLDPARFLGCQASPPGPGLHLLPPPE